MTTATATAWTVAEREADAAARRLRGYEDLLGGSLYLTPGQVGKAASLMGAVVDDLDAACRCHRCAAELGSRRVIRCPECRQPTSAGGGLGSAAAGGIDHIERSGMPPARRPNERPAVSGHEGA